MSSTPLHHQRLLHDIQEISSNPYPYITFVSRLNLNTACLILTPPELRPIHLTVTFPPRYPLLPPKITIQTKFAHPNVFDDYICASILNTDEGYTPAYTLRGIAIQILSFFNSDSIQDTYSGRVRDLSTYRERNAIGAKGQRAERFTCLECGFPNVSEVLVSAGGSVDSLGSNVGNLNVSSSPSNHSVAPRNSSSLVTTKKTEGQATVALDTMPPEILIRICDFLESESLIVFMRAWEKIGGVDGLVTEYGLIRKRELLCFATKEGFGTETLGVGVRIWGRGKVGTIESEFDLVSEKAYKKFGIRKSVQGIEFEHWLPLPLSRRHYQMVKGQVEPSLYKIGLAASLPDTSAPSVLIAFMTDIVVKLSAHAATQFPETYDYGPQSPPTSSLLHASERAIESYYHLFHLLLCCASTIPTLIPSINLTLTRFLEGHTSKATIPNLGHLLTMLLISDLDLTPTLTLALLREAITRNVVWMLDRQGANLPELSYMESDPISHFRLSKTYTASRTSYRLLMFANLFRSTALHHNNGTTRKSIPQLRDELFDSHGAPPRGTAERLAAEVKSLETVNDFPNFLERMGIPKSEMPRASEFTTLLRECCAESVKKGYSVWGMTQAEALVLRKKVEPNVGIREVKKVEVKKGDQGGWGVDSGTWGGDGRINRGAVSFFPGRGGRGNRGRR